MSSANAETGTDLFIVDRASLMKMMKSIGEMGEPCGTPIDNHNLLLVLSSIFIVVDRFDKKVYRIDDVYWKI